ncbi:MAG: HD domain-containing protein [Acidobacteria bacterium]|nr:HD domain-containing protein [Acidobacteriota bacterium]
MKTTETAKLLHAFSALADLGEQVADTRDFGQMVRSTLHVVLGALGVRRGAVAEHDADSSSLRFVASWGLGEEPLAPIPMGVGDVATFVGGGGRGRGGGDAGPPPARALASAEHFGARVARALAAVGAEIVTPLVVHTEFVGLILLGGKATDEPFSAEEREVVRTMARHIGVGIYNHRLLRELDRSATENRKLYDELRDIYRSTVRAFAAAIDSKDKYTQGHSERVGRYCEIIARELGWDERRVEAIAVGGYLHDVGKLVVERDIINAPYKIDAKQSSELNRHPAAGYDILIPIQHPDADIPLMAKYHHERLDGRGYPDGLTRDEIPLSARLVNVADSFDAMTTDRTYKRRKELREVVEDFRHNTGKQFEPGPVRALFRAMLRELDGEAKERHFIRLLGKEYFDDADSRELVAALLSDLDRDAAATASAA